jgi:hypothetical protein
MARQSFIIYCDESAEKGRFFSHFYGGVLINASDRQWIDRILNDQKLALNLHKELKWTRITKNYEQKYIDFIDAYFDLIKDGHIKLRIMFTQNIHTPSDLKEYQLDNQYFLLYYQMIKHAFGLRYCNPDGNNDVFVNVYMDDVPDKKEKFDEFKAYLHALCHYPVFRRAKVMILFEDITDIRSDEHVILQGLDIILGSIHYRLNDLHKIIPEGSRRRGKRTIAKEKVYKHINNRIREIYPRFNIGISTGTPNGETDRWEHPYRHWRFVPSDHELDLSKGKSARTNKPRQGLHKYP